LQGEFQQSLKMLTQGTLSEEVFDHWAFDAIPAVYEMKQAGAVVKAYPALSVRDNGVALQLFDTEFSARVSHKQGLLKLCMLALPQQVRYIKKQHALPEAAAIKFSAFGDHRVLQQGLVEMVFYRAFIADLPEVRNGDEFAQRLQLGRSRLGKAASEIQQLLQDILERHHAVIALLANDRSPARKLTRDDIRGQLQRLFPDGWMQCIPYHALLEYPRYLDAIVVRWQRLQGKLERDEQLIDELALLWGQYQNRLHKHQKEGVLDEALDNWRWALEEYRVSLFAQGIKTPYPVSNKRLQKMWQQVEA
jgi:ATP-dependent helicase HrpA